MKTSEKIDLIAPAFIQAQAEFLKASKSSTNPFFKSKYADLNSYLDGCSEGLRSNDLAILQDTHGTDEGQIIKVTTRLIHKSGQWMESEPLVLKPTDMKPQSFGSAQTYGRRYSLSSFLGLGAEDDDGNNASKDIEMPTRAAVNGELLELTTIEDYTKYAKDFQRKYTSKVWEWISKKRGDNKETWKMLFETHKNRIMKVSPLDDGIIQEFGDMVLNCSTHETYLLIAAFQEDNKCLSDQKYIDKLLELAKDFPE